jgi:hypothetical protein
MTTKVLLTHHHREAMENAADRGFWMPLPLALSRQQRDEVMYLTAVSYGDGSIRALAEITSFEFWANEGGVDLWLPFIGQLLTLPKRIPFGDRALLSGWLPRRHEQVQILELNALLAADRLSDLLPGSGASCPLPRQAAGLVPVERAAACAAPTPEQVA